MSPTEAKILRALAEEYGGDFGCFSFTGIAEASGVPLKDVRRAVRSLARKGFAECHHGLWTDDGRPAGSGYCCTKAGSEQPEAQERP